MWQKADRPMLGVASRLWPRSLLPRSQALGFQAALQLATGTTDDHQRTRKAAVACEEGYARDTCYMQLPVATVLKHRATLLLLLLLVTLCVWYKQQAHAGGGVCTAA